MRVTTSFLLASLALLGPGCDGKTIVAKKPKTSKKQIVITDAGPLSWNCIIDGNSVLIRAYLFPQSDNTKAAFEEWMEEMHRRIKHARRLAEEAPTPELRRFSSEEVQAFERGFSMGLIGSWEGWPIVMIYPVMAERTARDIVVCRSKKWKADVAFTCEFSEQVEDHIRFSDLLRALTAYVGRFTAEEVKSLPWEKESIYDKQGVITSTKLKQFADVPDAVFLRQH